MGGHSKTRLRLLGRLTTLLVLLGVINVACNPQELPTPAPVGRHLPSFASIAHKPLKELSGMVASRTYPDVVWVNNDSGHEPALFAIDTNGRVLLPEPWAQRGYIIGPKKSKRRTLFEGIPLEEAVNRDWEALASDGDRLYVCDLGNNDNERRDLTVYVVAEPNPRTATSARVLKKLLVAYPDQEAFPPALREYDCEATFVYGHKLYFLTKHRPTSKKGGPVTSTKLYRLDTEDASRVNQLTLVERHADLGGWVTDADLSTDGRTLAVLCEAPIQSVWLFDAPPSGDRFLSSHARRLVFSGAGQCEAIAFLDDHRILMGNEDNQLFMLETEDFQTQLRSTP